jgi:hypothetical protein
MNKKAEEALYECARQYEEFLGIVGQYMDAQKAWRMSDDLESDKIEKLHYKLTVLEERINKWLEDNL